MESNWRLNVWRFGQSNGPITLAARRLANPDEYVTNLNQATDPAQFWIYTRVDTQLIIPNRIVVRPVIGQHFPYGQAVAPD